jgi:arginine repressor
MADNIFPLFPKAATQTETITTAAQTLDITGRVVTLNVASGEAGVATLASSLPVGLLFQIVAGTIAGGATITITSASGNQTELLDATGEKVQLMVSSTAGDITVVAPLVADSSS